MKYWDHSWFVASDIWIFRFVLGIPPDYVKPLKRIDRKQDTLPIWWLKQGRLRSSANYVFTIFLEKDIQSLQMPDMNSPLIHWAPHCSVELRYLAKPSSRKERRSGHGLEDNSNHPTLRSACAYPPMSSWHHVGKSGWFPSFQYYREVDMMIQLNMVSGGNPADFGHRISWFFQRIWWDRNHHHRFFFGGRWVCPKVGIPVYTISLFIWPHSWPFCRMGNIFTLW
jgi:hypothetical protein